MDESLDKAFAALADPTRRAILQRLSSGEANVAELAEPFAMSQPSVSRHLKVLEEAGLIETRKDGQSRLRRLRARGIAPAQAYIADLARYWPHSFDRLQQFLDDTDPAKETSR